MGIVVSFDGYTPPPRFDVPPVAWTDVQIEEASAFSGPWTVIDTITFSVPDTDPANPQSRSFTTENGTAPNQWYRLTFIDGDGDFSNPSAPVQKNTATSRDLCDFADVLRYIPGYAANDLTDATFAALISSESEAIHDETGREIIAYGAQPASRAFEITTDRARVRRVEIGDLAAAGDSDITVEILAADDTVVEAVARDSYRPLYETKRQPLNPWEPITALAFPTGLGNRQFSAGQTLLVTGNWGFPSVPTFIREACAKRVILRYASDVASAGTQASAAIADINLAGLFASARDDVYRLKHGVLIA